MWYVVCGTFSADTHPVSLAALRAPRSMFLPGIHPPPGTAFSVRRTPYAEFQPGIHPVTVCGCPLCVACWVEWEKGVVWACVFVRAWEKSGVLGVFLGVGWGSGLPVLVAWILADRVLFRSMLELWVVSWGGAVRV
jgi:hypothetical protein